MSTIVEERRNLCRSTNNMSKYTTEAVKKSLFNLTAGCKAKYGETHAQQLYEELDDLFTAQQQALLDEVEKRLPNRTVDHTDGYNLALDEVTETLEAIKKEVL